MAVGSFTIGISLRELLLRSHVCRGQEDDFAVCGLGHSLHSLQVSDLHSRRRAQDVGGLTHEFGALDLRTRSNDLALSNPLALRRHAQRVLQFSAENDILDQHRLDLDAPARSNIFDYFSNGLGDFFTALDDILEDAGTNDVTEGGLGALDEGLADVGDAEGGFVGGGDVVVNYGGQLQVYVVFCHADLFWDLCGMH